MKRAGETVLKLMVDLEKLELFKGIRLQNEMGLFSNQLKLFDS